MNLVWIPLSSEVIGSVAENIERACDSNLASGEPKYFGPVALRRYDTAAPYGLLSEIYVFESVAYETEALATAAWQA